MLDSSRIQAEGQSCVAVCFVSQQSHEHHAIIIDRARRSFYHIARPLLYQNVFKFDNFASELRMINKPLGPSRCRRNGCACALPGVWVKELHLDIGDDGMPSMGIIRTETIEDSLRLMKTNLHVDKLVVQIRKHSFRTTNDVGASFVNFADALKKIKVGRALVIEGDGPKYWDLDIIGFAAHMDMSNYPYKTTIPKSEADARSTKSTFCIEFRSKYNVDNRQTAVEFMRAEDHLKIKMYFEEHEGFLQPDYVLQGDEQPQGGPVECSSKDYINTQPS